MGMSQVASLRGHPGNRNNSVVFVRRVAKGERRHRITVRLITAVMVALRARSIYNSRYVISQRY